MSSELLGNGVKDLNYRTREMNRAFDTFDPRFSIMLYALPFISRFKLSGCPTTQPAHRKQLESGPVGARRVFELPMLLGRLKRLAREKHQAGETGPSPESRKGFDEVRWCAVQPSRWLYLRPRIQH